MIESFSLRSAQLRLEPLEQRVVLTTTSKLMYAIAPGFGSAANINVYNADGSLRFIIKAFPGFLGGVQVASGDVNGDGYQDLIVAAEVGAGPHIQVFDGNNGSMIRNFFAYDPNFMGGISIAAGHISSNVYEDIITGPLSGADPHVEVFNGITNQLVRSFDAFSPSYRGGIYVAAGNTQAQLNDDIIVSMASSNPSTGNPLVKIFNSQTIALIRSFQPYSSSYYGGIYLASADVSGDGYADIVTGPTDGAPANVEIFNGFNGQLIKSFYAFGNSNSTTGARVAASDLQGNLRADIIVATGPTRTPIVDIFQGISVSPFLQTPLFYQQYTAFSSDYFNGIYVA